MKKNIAKAKEQELSVDFTQGLCLRGFDIYFILCRVERLSQGLFSAPRLFATKAKEKK